LTKITKSSFLYIFETNLNFPPKSSLAVIDKIWNLLKINLKKQNFRYLYLLTIFLDFRPYRKQRHIGRLIYNNVNSKWSFENGLKLRPLLPPTSDLLILTLLPWVNFINILRAHFSPIFWCQELQSWNVRLWDFLAKGYRQKIHA